MQTTAKFIGTSTLLLVLGTALTLPVAQAQGKAPTSQVCDDKENPPKDAVTQGGCVVISRTKGTCNSCHLIQGATSGNIAPPLVAMKQRFPDKAKLRAQVWDANAINPRSVMPPYGRHKIISDEEVDKVVEFLLTL